MDADMQAAAAAHRDGILANARGIEALAGRAVHVGVVRVEDVPIMQAAATAGDQHEALKLQAADTVASRLASTGDTSPKCLGCDTSIAGRPYSVLVVSAGTLDSPFLAGPVCTRCGTEPAAIRQAAEPTLRQVWPGFHHLPPAVNAVGHA